MIFIFIVRCIIRISVIYNEVYNVFAFCISSLPFTKFQIPSVLWNRIYTIIVAVKEINYFLPVLGCSGRGICYLITIVITYYYFISQFREITIYSCMNFLNPYICFQRSVWSALIFNRRDFMWYRHPVNIYNFFWGHTINLKPDFVASFFKNLLVIISKYIFWVDERWVILPLSRCRFKFIHRCRVFNFIKDIRYFVIIGVCQNDFFSLKSKPLNQLHCSDIAFIVMIWCKVYLYYLRFFLILWRLFVIRICNILINIILSGISHFFCLILFLSCISNAFLLRISFFPKAICTFRYFSHFIWCFLVCRCFTIRKSDRRHIGKHHRQRKKNC